MMGSSAQTVERLQKITMRVLPFDNATTHLLLNERLRRYFFPQHARSEPCPPLHGAVTFSADRFARRNFDDMIKGARRELLAAQYLSASHAAYDFVSRQ
ncbi:hypothetical protein V1283_000116 [Bradyrhizobium sp. AZCC 2262]|uniref:hypothetical protein n=1 Tax=Bradyrhizobium sp. AZCC 2262 TaxID=3117022 RepID=UPI002FF0C102